jgi:sulfite reductase (NADPH) hemoprotein beta-component
MYRYDEIDERIVSERIDQFRDQTTRFLSGKLSEDDFKPLRLQNGLYVQKHAPMLRVAIPYGLVNSSQMRMFAHIAKVYDRGYGHFSTRQNIQFNWPRLAQVPDILADLARVQMHGIQTSGNCIRNITSDHLAGIASDEIVNPLVWCEILRQWSTFHPEFAFLPRKFKIAVSGSEQDRAAILLHDIGLQAVRNDQGDVGFRVAIGGGLGRTPILGQVINEFLPWSDLLTFLDAVLRVYNRYGRRDNIYKARIKILVKEKTLPQISKEVHAEWAALKGGQGTLTREMVDAMAARFTVTAYRSLADVNELLEAQRKAQPGFARWCERNVHAHKVAGYAAVSLSLKRSGVPPGDVSAEQLEAIADLADRYSLSELRVTHEQNLILPDVEQSQLALLWQEAKQLGLATPNIGLLTNIIACPGGDFCSLANAVSIPVAMAIEERFDRLDYVHDIGELDLNISGCMNSCGHHHIGHIGILGVDKAGEEWYQISIGGDQGNRAALGKVIGPSFARHDVPEVVEKLIDLYLTKRESQEDRFIDVVQRVGIEPFKKHVYGNVDKKQTNHTRPLANA